MTWITQQLALDVLAITIDALNRIFVRIGEDDGRTVAALPPEVTTPTPQEQEAQQGAQEAPQERQLSPADAEALHTQAQTILRTIATSEGTDWITAELFPHYNITNLTDLPTGQLPDLIATATTHTNKDTK